MIDYNTNLFFCYSCQYMTFAHTTVAKLQLRIFALIGGMQDWNYLNTNCFEVTIELGCVKYPMATELPKYWEQNRQALLKFLQQVMKSCNVGHLTLGSLRPFRFIQVSVFVGSHWHKGNGHRR